MDTTQELLDIVQFIKDFRLGDSIKEMEEDLQKAIGYSQRVGELQNEAEFVYHRKYAEQLNKLGMAEDETETTRKVKLESWTAEAKLVWQNLKTMTNSLKAVRMSLMQAIRTRREEPYR